MQKKNKSDTLTRSLVKKLKLAPREKNKNNN